MSSKNFTGWRVVPLPRGNLSSAGTKYSGKLNIKNMPNTRKKSKGRQDTPDQPVARHPSLFPCPPARHSPGGEERLECSQQTRSSALAIAGKVRAPNALQVTDIGLIEGRHAKLLSELGRKYGRKLIWNLCQAF